MFPSGTRRAVLLCLLLGASACVPRARPLAGTPVPAALPSGELPPHAQRVVFRWTLEDQEFGAAGEGLARIAPPDSGRLDLWLAGGFGGGHALLLGDSIHTPAGDLVKRFLPPPPLLWASVGRLAVPPAADTAAVRSGDTLRADIGRDPTWRVTFVATRLTRLERLERGRVVEWVARAPDGDVRYRNEQSRRSLVLDVSRTDTVPGFDPSIWRR